MWRERCGSSGKRCGSGWCGSGGCAGLACSPSASRPSARCSACAWAGERASGGCRGHGSSSPARVQRVTMPFVNVSRATSERREGSAATKSVRRNPRGREGPCFVAWICRLRTGLGGTRARAPRGRTSAWRARHGPRDRTGAGRPCHTSPHPYNAVHGESIPLTVTAAPLQYVVPKHTKQKPRAWRAARRARTCLLTAHSHRRSQTLARAVEVPPLSVNADTEAKWHERQST